MPKPYVPDTGHIVWLDFNPQAGHEQSGHRPALVLSPAAYNEKTSLMICCPMTTKIKGYAFEVQISSEPPCAVLADQIKNMDWRKRGARKKGVVTKAELKSVRAKIHALIIKGE